MAADRHRDPEGLSRTVPGAAVFLDSNFLFIPLRFGLDIFDELHRLLSEPLRILVPKPVIEELRLLRLDAKPSFIKQIEFALGLVERCEVLDENLDPGENVDDFILRIASQTGYPVATNDADLRQRLRAIGIPVVYMRQRAFLEIDGII
jgi:rRNA-processing protein FCF1